MIETSSILLHPNGFLQIGSEKQRIHVWSGDIPRQVVPSPIHDHRFSFVSKVLHGVLWNIKYEVNQDDGGGFSMYSIQSSGEALLVDSYRYSAKVVSVEVIRAGETYSLPFGIFHETRTQGFAVTLLTKTYENLFMIPRILVPYTYEPDNEFSRILEGMI